LKNNKSPNLKKLNPYWGNETAKKTMLGSAQEAKVKIFEIRDTRPGLDSFSFLGSNLFINEHGEVLSSATHGNIIQFGC